MRFTNDCLGPVATVLLVVGAGGGFSKTLEFSGVGKAITAAVVDVQFSPILLGWLLACLLRIAAGSATVAISTAAGIMANQNRRCRAHGFCHGITAREAVPGNCGRDFEH